MSAAEDPGGGGAAVDAEPAGSTLRSILYWVSLPLISLAIVLVIRTTVVEPYRIPTGSMLPTIQIGDRVLVNRLSYRSGEIERGQVIVFEKPPSVDGDNDLIKRVVGLPGDTIRFDGAEVYIDGWLMVEPYLAQESSTRARPAIRGCADVSPVPGICVVPPGHVFVLGDNRRGSIDSRSFGPIPIDTIIGRAFWRIWPVGDLAQI